MSTLKLTFAGVDYWGRRVYKDAKGNFYKDIEIFSEQVSDELYTSCPSKDFEGEPGWPITDFTIV